MRIALTPAFVAAALAEAGADRTIYWDVALRNFGLQVTASGHKSFVVQYRNAEGRDRRMALKADVLGLGEARRQARSILGDVAKGNDPLAERRKVKAEATNTLQAVCDEYFNRECGMKRHPDGRVTFSGKLRTARLRYLVLLRLVYPVLGSRQIEHVKRSDLVRLLDKVEDQNGAVMADHVLAYLRRVFFWYASRSDDFRTPITRGMSRTKPTERARTRVLTDDEIRRVWQAAGELKNAFGPLVRYILVTATRLNEAAQMRRSEIDGNLWSIPASRSKSKRDCVVPLSMLAQSVLASIPQIGNSDLVFTHDGKRAAGGFSKFKAQLDRASGVSDFTNHDLRRTARSLMSRSGVNADVGERCLNHVIRGVRGIYDRYEYLDEKRAAFEALATEVERIVGAV
jgi:integrase